MIKVVKFAVAVFLVSPDDKEEFLLVKRPPEDDRLPNVWGLPAVISNNEPLEEAVKRVGIEKLSTQIEPINIIGVKAMDRGDYELTLVDIVARLIGQPPSVYKAQTTGIRYIDQKWTHDYHLLKDAASKGSLCSQIVLDSKNIGY
jgi:ADP-ribose pyrophosphatase YjhB (NUDIX family)